MSEPSKQVTGNIPAPSKPKRGFAAMTEEKRKAIARKGAQTLHSKGYAHQFSPEEARQAGRKGGIEISKNRDYMAAIGRKGGLATARKHGNAAARKQSDQQHPYTPH